ncbi:MAG: NADH-quinone oxidoreductase subunit L [Fimbriimonadaceae bacterium]
MRRASLSNNLIWAVLFLPLAGSLFQALFGSAIVRALGEARGKKVLGIAAVLPIAIGFLIAVGITVNLARGDHEAQILTLFEWIKIYGLSIPFEVRIDTLSMTMVLIITGIGALIHLYATGYMAEDSDYPRFFTYLNLFISAMLILVLGNNLALMFIGWEGVGLCSYLLIAFWYKDIANAKAGNKAFIVNRIGDWGFTLGMFTIVAVLAGNADRLVGAGDRWLSYDVILPNAAAIFSDYPGVTTFAALMLFVGAAGKSAQFPLYFWLPDAMAGPTPVSALIHAATMVTAGVFLLNRMHVLFEMSPIASAVVVVVGAFTALFAALIAFGQTDIKKVLAYSTVSQLGFMFIACGSGAYWAGMFHVTTNAFFKALLFLGAGAVIYAMAHEQDMRRYGNLQKYLKITTWTMVIGTIAIAGVPPLAGFFSKEAILGAALGNRLAAANLGFVAGWVGLGVAALTAMYMARMTMLTFFGGEERWRTPAAAHGAVPVPPEAAPIQHDSAGHGPDEHGFFLTHEEMAHEHEHHHHGLEPSHTPKEAPPSMTVPLVVLAVLALVGGFLLEGYWSFESWLEPESGPTYLAKEVVRGHPYGWVGTMLMPLSIAAALLGLAVGIMVYRRGLPKKEGYDETKWNPFRRWAGRQFGYDDMVMDAGVKSGGQFGEATKRWFDESIIDGIVNGMAYAARSLGSAARSIQTGFVRMYALMMLIGGVAFLAYFAYALSKSKSPVKQDVVPAVGVPIGSRDAAPMNLTVEPRDSRWKPSGSSEEPRHSRQQASGSLEEQLCCWQKSLTSWQETSRSYQETSGSREGQRASREAET